MKKKKKTSRTCHVLFFLPWPLSLLTQQACVNTGSHIIVCMCVGRWSKYEQSDSKWKRKRERQSLGAIGVCLCLRVQLHTCVSVTDWLAARFHRPSARLHRQSPLLRERCRVGEFRTIFFPALAALSFLPMQPVGHTRHSMPNTLPSIPLTF